MRATSGDTHLGGEDFDQRIIKYCISQVGLFFYWRPSDSASSGAKWECLQLMLDAEGRSSLSVDRRASWVPYGCFFVSLLNDQFVVFSEHARRRGFCANATFERRHT